VDKSNAYFPHRYECSTVTQNVIKSSDIIDELLARGHVGVLFWHALGLMILFVVLASPVCLDFVADSRWLVVGLDNGTVMVRPTFYAVTC